MSDYAGVPGSGFAIDEDDINQQFIFREGPRSVINASTGVTLTAADCGKIVANISGAGAASTRPVNLPPAAAGLRFMFVDQTANGLRVVATGGAKIGSGVDQSGANGYIETTTIRQVIKLHCDGTNWFNERDDQPNLNIA